MAFEVGQNPHHPEKGTATKVEPIRDIKAIKRIKKILAGNYRDTCLFNMGINSAYRANELLSIKVRQVAHLKSGDLLDLKQSKVKQYRAATLNQVVIDSIQELLANGKYHSDDYLFKSQRQDVLIVPTVNSLVKKWCCTAGCVGNYGSHTLRKTWGYHQRQRGTPIPLLMEAFGHKRSSKHSPTWVFKPTKSGISSRWNFNDSKKLGNDMIDSLTIAGAKAVTKAAANVLKNAFNYRQTQRVKTFLNAIDLRYEQLEPVEVIELEKHINSEEGQEILASFADSITSTDSKVAHMAIALLYCGDKEIALEKLDIKIFVSAMERIDDDLIDFFLSCMELKTISLPHAPYSKKAISEKNFLESGFDRWGEEWVFAFGHDLINRRLFLPDPVKGGSSFGSASWSIGFGVTDKSEKFASLLRKAKLLSTSL